MTAPTRLEAARASARRTLARPLRSIRVDADSITIGTPPKGNTPRYTYWAAHIEFPWSDCVRIYDAPRRAYLQLGPIGTLTIGLPTRNPGGRWRLETAQAWSPTRGFRGTRPHAIVYQPDRWARCDQPVGPGRPIPTGPRAGQIVHEHCGALRWHPGPCSQPAHRTPTRRRAQRQQKHS